MVQKLLKRRSFRGDLLQAHSNKISTCLRIILSRGHGWITIDDLVESCPHLLTFKRIFSKRTLDQRQPDCPHISRSGIGTAGGGGGDSLRRHVAMTADMSLGQRLDQLSGHTKITQFDLSQRVEQNICRFNVAMNDVQFFLQKPKSTHHLYQK